MAWGREIYQWGGNDRISWLRFLHFCHCDYLSIYFLGLQLTDSKSNLLQKKVCSLVIILDKVCIQLNVEIGEYVTKLTPYTTVPQITITVSNKQYLDYTLIISVVLSVCIHISILLIVLNIQRILLIIHSCSICLLDFSLSQVKIGSSFKPTQFIRFGPVLSDRKKW